MQMIFFSTLEMELEGDFDFRGIKGHKYMPTEKCFDNGTLYTEMECYAVKDEEQPSGVRNVSECK